MTITILNKVLFWIIFLIEKRKKIQFNYLIDIINVKRFNLSTRPQLHFTRYNRQAHIPVQSTHFHQVHHIPILTIFKLSQSYVLFYFCTLCSMYHDHVPYIHNILLSLFVYTLLQDEKFVFFSLLFPIEDKN